MPIFKLFFSSFITPNSKANNAVENLTKHIRKLLKQHKQNDSLNRLNFIHFLWMRITETVLLFSFHSYKITTHAPETAGARQLVIVWSWYVYDLTGGLTSRGRRRSRDSGLNQRWWEAEHTWAMSSPIRFFFSVCICVKRRVVFSGKWTYRVELKIKN